MKIIPGREQRFREEEDETGKGKLKQRKPKFFKSEIQFYVKLAGKTERKKEKKKKKKKERK